jgi:hypothetical protein
MRYLSTVLPCVLLWVTTFGCGAAGLMGAEPAAATEPATYLYDAPEASAAPLAAQKPAPMAAWSKLEEDDTTHRFQGRAVLVNDKIMAVLQSDTTAIELYARQRPVGKRCARLQPVCDGSVEGKRTSLTVKENNRSCVSLEVSFRSPHGELRQITYELNAGQPFIKTTAGAGIEKLRVEAPCRFAVLPDFFGDDIVVDAAAMPVRQADLPSENFLLHLIDGGDAIVMTVSESRDNDIAVSLSAQQPREIECSDISYGKKPHVWVAVLAEKDLWHQHAVALDDAGKLIPLDWQMPFAALWRVDWATADKLSESWEMLLQQSDGKYVMQGWFGQNESEGQSFGKEFGPRDWNKPDRKRWNPVLGSFLFPCWIDHAGRGYLQPLKQRRYTERGSVCNFDGPVVVYPIDRAQVGPFSTPLEKLTVVDLVRMTLGVGPCQYILDLEGQKRNSRGVATCYARDVINAIYEEGNQLQQGPAIEEHLDAAVAFIRNVRERIDQYVQFGHELASFLEEQRRLRPHGAEFCDELLSITRRLDQYFAQNRENIRTPADAEHNAQTFRANLLRYTGPDAYKKCASQMAVFTSIGGAQDGLVASCRMIVKTLRQRAGIAMAVDPQLKEIATHVRERTQTMLRNATPYEAPRH